MYVIMQNLVKRGKRFLKYCVFIILKVTDVAILDIQIFKFLATQQVGRANMHRHIKFHKIGQTAEEIQHCTFFIKPLFAILDFFKM